MIVCPSRDQPKYIKTKVLTTCFYLMQSIFQNKKRSGTSLLTSFSAWFLKKNIFTKHFNWSNIIAWLPPLLNILGNMCIAIIFCPVCDVINFEINHSFLIKAFFYITNKLGQKCKYLKKEKSSKPKTKSIFC